MAFRSARIDKVKMVINTVWGIRSSGGAGLRSEKAEKNIAVIGMNRSRLDGCGFIKVWMSFVRNIRKMHIMKAVDSMEIFARVLKPIPRV